jgi:ComF family protein
MVYERLARHLIINFKDHDATLYAPIFAQWINRIIQEFSDEIDIMIPVPITNKRRLFRKYNQTELLCLELQKLSKLHYEPRILEKTKETVAQKTLNREKRLKNLKKSFSLNPEFSVKHKNILLIDDVITTGATANACAQLLKEDGADKVYVATLARVTLNSTPPRDVSLK